MNVMASQLATYDQAKEAILARRGPGADGLATHVAASFTAGLLAAAVSNPVDVVKTRMMNMKAGAARSSPMRIHADKVIWTAMRSKVAKIRLQVLLRWQIY